MSTTPISTNAAGQPITGTAGSSVSNPTATSLNSSEFLDLMMTELTHQDPTNPDSSDPTQYLTELAQMTSVEQETNTAQSTAQSASAQAVTAAVSLIGDTISYISQTTGQTVTGTVNSVQITGSGPTLTVNGLAGIAPSTVTDVEGSSSSSGSAAG
jgi:flagellar basal-body rod modification protein FlgD